MASTLSGRLVTDGSGKLYIHPTDANGEVVPSIHLVDSDGVPTDELIELIEVRWDEDSGGYVEVTDGQSHNSVHEMNVLEVSGTTGPLFDSDGNLVVAGDPHHEEPLPNDPHYDAGAPGKVTMHFDPDEVAAKITGHTDAYTK